MSHPPALLGIDGGGTATVAWLADPEGRVLGRGRGGPSNAKAVGLVAAQEALSRAIADAFADASTQPGPVSVACLGIAGFDRPDDRAVLAGWAEQAGWAERIVLVNDGELVVAAGTPEGWGLGVIAGTGSIAVGRTPSGRTARAGGWGPLVGDEGSAYAVALSALRLLARRCDGRDQQGADSGTGNDPLSRHLCAALGISSPAAMVSALHAPGFDRTRIAALAPAVLEAAQADRELVAKLLAPAGLGLAEMVIAVARALGWFEGKIPLALAGSFLLAATDVSNALLGAFRRSGFDPVATPVFEPVRGALILAAQALVDARNRP